MPSFLKDQPHRILLLGVGLCVTVLGILTLFIPPGIDPDPCWGLMIMRNMEQGGHFNLLASPDFANIAQNQYQFLSWWSPGQYMLPYLFKILLQINTAHAIAITVMICSLIGLLGFYKLFKLLGFTKWIAAISIAFITSQLFFVVPFNYYMGGEVLLFAFTGWFIYGGLSFKIITWHTLIFVFLAGLIGFFAKSSFLWMYAAGLACMWVNVSTNQNQEGIISWLKNGILLAGPFFLSIAVIYVFYLSKGDNPSSAQAGMLFKPESFTYPVASPILSAFSFDEFFDGFIYHPNRGIHTANLAILSLYPLSVCFLAYLGFTIRSSVNKKYKLVIACFYVIAVVFFSYMFLKQATISLEGRHFRILGLLFIPGFVYLCFKTKISKIIFFAGWMFVAYISIRNMKDGYISNNDAARGNTGLSQLVYDKPTMAEIMNIDHNNHNAIFVLTGSDIAAEINNNRVITYDNDTPDDGIASIKYYGKAGPIYVLIPTAYIASGRKDIIIKTFVGYHNFQSKQLSPDYYLYYAN